MRPTRDTYLLKIYRNRGVSGWQWAARLVDVSGGETVRFSDPEALLAHLERVIHCVDRAEAGDTDEATSGAPATCTADEGADGDSESPP